MKNRIHLFILFVLFLGVLLCAYAPVVFGRYLHHDDYLFWVNRMDGLSAQHMFLVATGRIIGAWMLTGSQHLVEGVADFNFIRLLSIATYSGCAVLLCLWMRPYFYTQAQSFMFTALVFTLPPFASIIMWGTCMYTSVGLLLSMGAAFAASKAYRSAGRFRRLYIVLFFQLLVMSFLIYHTAGLFYWVMVAMRLFSGRDPGDRMFWQECMFYAGLGLAAMAAYGIILKFYCQNFAVFLTGIYNPYDLTTDYMEKLAWFVREPLLNAVNLWNIFPHHEWVRGTVLFFIIGVLFFIVKEMRRGKSLRATVRTGLLTGGLFVLFFVLSYLPNLLNKQPAPFYRSGLGIEVMIVLGWLWAIQQWLRFLPAARRSMVLTVVLIIGLGFGAHTTCRNVYLFRVLPSQIELGYIKDVLSSHDLTGYAHIAVIQPEHRPYYRYDEFGVFSSYFKQDVTSMIRCAVRETGKFTAFQESIKGISIVTPDAAIKAGTLLLDMRKPLQRYEEFLTGILPG